MEYDRYNTNIPHNMNLISSYYYCIIKFVDFSPFIIMKINLKVNNDTIFFILINKLLHQVSKYNKLC